MKKIPIVGFALFAALAFGALTASSAFATSPEWLVDELSVTEANAVHVENIPINVLLSDLKEGVTVLCEGGVALGLVWEKMDVVETEEVATKCVESAGTCPSPTAKAIDLPWLTELVSEGGETRDLILEDGKGAPGWKVICAGFVEDTCTTNAGFAALDNNLTEMDVVALFNQESIATCSRGGANSGEVLGEILIRALEELLLAWS